MKRVIVAAALLGSACTTIVGSGREMEDERSVASFQSVRVANGLKATVIIGEAQSVVVKGDDNIVPELQTVVEGGALIVKMPDRVTFSSSIGVGVTVTVPSLTGLQASGGSVVTASEIEAERFSLTASGGSVVSYTGTSNRLEVDASGGSVLTLVGETDELVLSSSGGSVHKGKALDSRIAEVSASGGSSLTLAISERLKLSLSGGSVLRVKGRPEVTTSSLSGGSTFQMGVQ